MERDDIKELLAEFLKQKVFEKTAELLDTILERVKAKSGTFAFRILKDNKQIVGYHLRDKNAELVVVAKDDGCGVDLFPNDKDKPIFPLDEFKTQIMEKVNEIQKEFETYGCPTTVNIDDKPSISEEELEEFKPESFSDEEEDMVLDRCMKAMETVCFGENHYPNLKIRYYERVSILTNDEDPVLLIISQDDGSALCALDLQSQPKKVSSTTSAYLVELVKQLRSKLQNSLSDKEVNNIKRAESLMSEMPIDLRAEFLRQIKERRNINKN